ncbi:MAG: formyltransferase family protein [Planctomycetales bacterium]|nr:formyltransferase family protein [Planctomycetales bacterium]
MQVTITAVGPDHKGLADPIIHYVTGAGANIHEIQMYDRDSERLFAMLMRIEWSAAPESVSTLRSRLQEIGKLKGLQVRVWSRDEHARPPRLAICTTFRSEPPLAILRAIRDKRLKAEAAVMIGNRNACRSVADQFNVPWINMGDSLGNPDYSVLEKVIDEQDIDYVILARYMRVLPAELCWKFAGGRIINLHHGLLPSFPGFRPYEDAYQHHMLCFGATVHFIVPELDAGNQIVYQGAFSVLPGTALSDIKRLGESDHEPNCLLEGLRRVVDREVELHFHRVARITPPQ